MEISEDQNTIIENGKKIVFLEKEKCSSCIFNDSEYADLCIIAPCSSWERIDCKNGNFILSE